MKRRSFCRYLILGSATLVQALPGNNSFAADPKLSQAKLHHRWVVLYWMPYDNNLVNFGEPIIEMLSRGTQNSETVVVIQSDYYGEPKMRRRQLVNGSVNEIDISGEDSSDISSFTAYLDWAYKSFDAQHWAVIVVGHGGKINEISLDEHKTTHQSLTWMKLDQFANAVRNFNRAVHERVELLFFQNCYKATLEVIYEAKNCARYTLASQLALGAPNYYYEGFLQYLNNPSVRGFEAAKAIMNAERSDMYHTLTLINNQAVKQIRGKLSLLLKSLVNEPLVAVKLSDLPTYYYMGEQHCDLVILLNLLSKISTQSQEEFAKFAKFIHSSVIEFYQTGGKLNANRTLNTINLENLCGLGLYFPETAQMIDRYHSLALYQDVDLISLYRKILINAV